MSVEDAVRGGPYPVGCAIFVLLIVMEYIMRVLILLGGLECENIIEYFWELVMVCWNVSFVPSCVISIAITTDSKDWRDKYLFHIMTTSSLSVFPEICNLYHSPTFYKQSSNLILHRTSTYLPTSHAFLSYNFGFSTRTGDINRKDILNKTNKRISQYISTSKMWDGK